jgi:hypothetical protein
MLHSSQQLPVAPLEPSRSSPSRTRSIKPSCRTQVAAQNQVVFRCFVGCNYSPLHLRKSVSNGF